MKNHKFYHYKMSCMRKILLLLLAVLLLQQATLAQNTWTGSTGTDWNTGTNWSTGQAPTATDDVIIAASGNQPVISIAGGSKNRGSAEPVLHSPSKTQAALRSTVQEVASLFTTPERSTTKGSC